MLTERILAQTRHHGLLVLDALTGVALSSFKNASGDPSSACFLGTSPFNSHNAASHSFLMTADSTRPFMHIVPLDRSNEIQALHSHSVPERLPALALSPCGSLCFCGGVSGNLYVWDMASGDLLRCWRAHYKSITHLAVSEDGAFLFSAGEDAVVCCYCMEDILVLPEDKTRDPIRLHRWTAHAMPITSMAYFSLGPHQILIATASADQTLQFWRPHCDDPVLSFSFPVPIRHLAANPVTMECYICAGDSNIYVLDAGRLTDATTASFSMTENGNGFATPLHLDTLPVFTGHQPHGGVAHCCCNAEGSILVSCASDGLRFWDTLSRQTVKHMPALRDVLTAVTIFSTSNRLPSGNSHDGGLTKRMMAASHLHGHTGGGGGYLFPGQTLLGGIFSSCLTETTYFPPIAAFKRKCMDSPPTVFRCSVNPERRLQDALQTAVADILRNDTDTDITASRSPPWCSRQLREVQRLKDLSGLLEANALHRTLNREREEQKKRNSVVVDLVDTLCTAAAGANTGMTVTDDRTVSVSPNYCYTSDLQDVPLEPFNPNRPFHHFPLENSFQNAGVHRPASLYLDRSFVPTKAKGPYSSRAFSGEKCFIKAETEALQNPCRTSGLDALFFVPSEHSESDAEELPITSDATNFSTDKDDDDNWASDLATLEDAESFEATSTEETSGKESNNDPDLHNATCRSYKKTTPNDSPVALSVTSSSSKKASHSPCVLLTPSPCNWTRSINGTADNPSACESCYNPRIKRGLKRVGKKSSIFKHQKLVTLRTQLHEPGRHNAQTLDVEKSMKNMCTLSASSSSPLSDSADDFSEVASRTTPCDPPLSIQRPSSEVSKSPSSSPAFKFKSQRNNRYRNLPRSRSGLRRLNVHSKMAALIHHKTLLTDPSERRGPKHAAAAVDSSPSPIVLSSPTAVIGSSHLNTLNVRPSEHRVKVSQTSLLLSKARPQGYRRRLRFGIRESHQSSS